VNLFKGGGGSTSTGLQVNEEEEEDVHRMESAIEDLFRALRNECIT